MVRCWRGVLGDTPLPLADWVGMRLADSPVGWQFSHDVEKSLTVPPSVTTIPPVANPGAARRKKMSGDEVEFQYKYKLRRLDTVALLGKEFFRSLPWLLLFVFSWLSVRELAGKETIFRGLLKAVADFKAN